jgi:hypothetical protein
MLINIALIAIFFTSNLFVHAQEQCPNGIRVRKEFRDLTKEEFASFKRALKVLRDTKDPATGNSQYDKWPAIHIEAAVTAHR